MTPWIQHWLGTMVLFLILKKHLPFNSKVKSISYVCWCVRCNKMSSHVIRQDHVTFVSHTMIRLIFKQSSVLSVGNIPFFLRFSRFLSLLKYSARAKWDPGWTTNSPKKFDHSNSVWKQSESNLKDCFAWQWFVDVFQDNTNQAIKVVHCSVMIG